MKLSFQKIKELTVGAVEIREEKDAIRFYKCTVPQVKIWREMREDFGIRAEETSGIRLDFHTNAEEVIFTVRGKRFEVKINSVLYRQFANESGDFFAVKLSLPAGEKRVTLFFPSFCSGMLRSVEISDTAWVLPHQFDRKFLFIGDSITQGCQANFDCLSFANRVSDYFNAESVICGIGGAYFDKRNFEKTDFNPKTIFVAYGCNDFDHYETVEEMYQNAIELLELIRNAYPDEKIFILSPTWRTDAELPHGMGVFSDCRKVISKASKTLRLPLIDAYDFIPHMTEFFNDIVHPNDLGFSFYAEKLIFELSKSGI